MKENTRELGLRRVIKARQTNPDEQTVRVFNAPTINIEAKDYIEIIDWLLCKCKLTSTHTLRKITDDEIKQTFNMAQCAVPNWGIVKRFPRHTQSVERCVKLVTEAAMKVCEAQS